ncbi:hypothetical protein niasHT_014558 [Heterodera trifolii]|uniref:DNA-directed DNA polymerase n=1 Tax=Heterodera trifolii TaxID=157864 RepID=A0ABD2LK88_9BILA
MASALLRFQLGSSVRPVSSDNFPKNQAKNLSEIVRFNGSGSFFVRAIVSNFQYRIYNSCPQKNGGVLCRRKLGDNGICPKCGHQSEKPNQNLLIRLELVDLKDQTVKQNVSAFSLTAENFLGLNTEQLSTMANKEPENLAKHLEKNLGRPLSAKISVKMLHLFKLVATVRQKGKQTPTLRLIIGVEELKKKHQIAMLKHNQKKMEKMEIIHITEFVLNANYHEHQGDQQFVTASDETLNATFEQLIDQAIKNAEQQSDGRHVSKIGIVLDGKGLNDPIVLPLRPPIQNNAHVLMMELEKIGQSDGDDQVHGGGMNKRSLLLSEAVQISITCLAPPVGSAPRFYPHQHWGYNEKQLIRIRNEDDNFCLFHALVAARAFHDHELHMEQTKHKQTTMLTGQQLVNSKTSKIFCSNYEAFNRLLSNTQLMNKTVAELITAAEIPTNLEAYGLEHIKSVQDYWDKSTPGLYRIVLFEHAPAELPRPLWKGPPGRRFNVTLFLQEGHYNAIKRINSFFNLGRKYCIDCECSYGNDRKHTVNSTSTYIKVHHEKKKGCFIQQIVIPNKKHKYRIVVYDTETRLETLKEGQQRHKVNYLSARVTCTECCDSLATEILNCEICTNNTGLLERSKDWYAQNVQNSFYLREELKKYCQNDTEILLKAIVEFRRILMTEVTDGYDVLPLSCTIASACMNIFRGIFMEEDQLALVPEAGYERNDRASVFAIKYLDWRSKTEGLQIQHAGNGREKQWKKYKLDGWIEEQNKCIEVLGCYWHGCERCFAPEDLLVDGKSCRELNVATYDRLLQIREPDDDGQCIEVEEVWECEINAQLTKNAEMKTFFDDLGNERGPIDPRAAYCGGRTGPLRLFAEPEADEKISVFDIVSLYPWVNYTTEYPVGIPQIIRPEHDEMFVNWTRPDDLKYHGIYRVRIVPPRGLRIPVLPVKIDERLLFCCCHHCASAFRKRATCVQHKCPHSDAQRAFTGNYTHIELERALESGYRVDRFWRAWHYEECLWTTSRARLKLLDYMQQIDRTEGAHLLYTDTDSVTVMHKKDLVPIKTGQYLGEMSAKQYGFRMLDKLTGNEEFVQKIRGITFDVENSKALQFHHFRQQVLNYAKNNDDDSCGASANIQEDEINCPAIFRYSKIQPMRDSKVITRQQCKRYLPVCQKGIITNDLNVLPFGFE